MIRTLVIGVLLAAVPGATDLLVDYQFRQSLDQNVGYSQSDRDGMAKLIRRSTAKTKHPMSEGERRAALLSLWGGQ